MPSRMKTMYYAHGPYQKPTVSFNCTVVNITTVIVPDTFRGLLEIVVKTDEIAADIDSLSFNITNPSNLGCAYVHCTVKNEGVTE